MKFDWDKFFEDKTLKKDKTGSLIVHCGTIEEKIHFFEELNNRVCEDNYNYNTYGDDWYFSYNYVSSGLGYCTRQFYETEGAEIVDWKDYMSTRLIPKLENGLVVDTRDGDRYFIFNNKLMSINRINWLGAGDYNEDLKYVFQEDGSHLDIMKVYKTRGYSLNTLMQDLYLDLIWERVEIQDIKIPAIYKHFKDKYYATMGIARRMNRKDFFNELGGEDCGLDVKYTEDDIMIDVIKIGEEYYFYNCKVPDGVDEIVLYKSLYDDTHIYGRPLKMFASKVDKVKYPDVKQEWRMELYQY